MASKDPLLSPADDIEASRGLSEALTRDSKERRRTILQWKNIEMAVGDKKILHGLTGSARPGEVVCIMGSSGAGKSTLLNVLAGRTGDGNVTGTVELNGTAYSPGKLRRSVAYVEQEDALFPTQTVREALTFAAALKLGCEGPERDALVNLMLDTLRLTKCADTLVGSQLIRGISGGEKKRTSIGVELISNPDVILLDECTSGLDSFSSMLVIKTLRRLAADGCTVVCTIHQPGSELFELFDRTILLANGRTVFEGTTPEMLDFFASKSLVCPPRYNPSDFVVFTIQTVDNARLAELCDSYKNDIKPNQDKEVETLLTSIVGENKQQQIIEDEMPSLQQPQHKPANIMTQMFWLSRREFLNLGRNRASLIARVGATILLNLIVGLVFKGAAIWPDESLAFLPGGQGIEAVNMAIRNHYGCLTQLTVSSLFGLSQPMILAFPVEKPIFLREYAGHTYSAVPYFISKFLVEVPTTLIQSLVAMLMTYFLLGLQGEFFEMVCITALLGMVAASTALVISAASPNVTVAIQISPFLFVPQLLFSGIFLSLNAIPPWLRWSQVLCSLKYALNLMTIVEFRHVPTAFEGAVTNFMESNDIYRSQEWISVAILLALFFSFRTAACVILTMKGRKLS